MTQTDNDVEDGAGMGLRLGAQLGRRKWSGRSAVGQVKERDPGGVGGGYEPGEVTNQRCVVMLEEQWPPGTADREDNVGKKMSGEGSSTHSDNPLSCYSLALAGPHQMALVLCNISYLHRQPAHHLLSPSF